MSEDFDRVAYLKKSILLFNDVFGEPLKQTQHSKTLSPYHLEGDVYTHTMMVVSVAVKKFYLNLRERDAKCLLWACLLHDVGKPEARFERDDGKVVFKGHEYASAAFATEFLNENDLGLYDEDELNILFAIITHSEAHEHGDVDEFLQSEDLVVHGKLVNLLRICDEEGRIHL